MSVDGGAAVACDHCRWPFAQSETLCAVCDSPNPWTRRDSLHFLCRECGTTQSYFRGAAAGSSR